jgi:flagellar biosynthesis/type III secretory pathway protein FliH
MRSDLSIKLPAPLRGATVVDSTAAFPPLKSAIPARTGPPPAPKTSPVPAPTAEEQRQGEVARRLEADRRLIESLRDGLVTEVGQLRRQWQDEAAERLAQSRRVAVELALTIATKLLHQQIAAGAFPVEDMVRDMLRQLDGEQPVTVRLNPDDLALLGQRLDGRPLLPDGATEPRLVTDSALGRGDCRVEADGRLLLSEVAGQLTEIRNQLLRSLGHAGP